MIKACGSNIYNRGDCNCISLFFPVSALVDRRGHVCISFVLLTTCRNHWGRPAKCRSNWATWLYSTTVLQDFFNTSVQPSTTIWHSTNILGRKVHISCVDCNFHFWWAWLCNVSNLDQIFKILTKIQHYLPHRDLHISYITIPVLGDRYKPRMRGRSQCLWLYCFNSQVSDFQNEANKNWKQYSILHINGIVLCYISWSSSRSEVAIQFCVVHFEMLKKAFATVAPKSELKNICFTWLNSEAVECMT